MSISELFNAGGGGGGWPPRPPSSYSPPCTFFFYFFFFECGLHVINRILNRTFIALCEINP